MKYLYLSVLAIGLLAAGALAQPANGSLDIQFNKNILQPGDSLLVRMQYTGGVRSVQQGLATVALIIENEQGQRTRLRWPMIEGKASGTLYIPDSLPQGRYSLLAGLQQRSFEVSGQVQNAKNIGNIEAMLLTKNGDWDRQEVPVSPGGTFTIRNWLLEDNALLAFSATNNRKQPLDIRISTRLDSGNAPLAVAGRSFYIGSPSPELAETLSQRVETPGAVFTDPGNLLPAVLVRTTIKTPAQQFNEEHVSALFRSDNERMLSIMDDPSAIALPNIMSYLQGRVAGLQITGTGFDGGSASWRGGAVTFFLDEMRVSPQLIANIPITDIAIVKAFPPPFFGAAGSGGGAIAVYTRRGGEGSYLPANRKVFRVRGYTPGAVVLEMNKLQL